MKLGWVADDPGYVGGAELTQAEFKRAAPSGIEIVEVRPHNLDELDECERVVVNNCMQFPPTAGERWHGKPTTRFHHDVSVAPAEASLTEARHVFCSPLQQKRMKMEGECIPPALDLTPFEAVANQNHRKGAVCVGRMAYNKGLDLLAEYEEPVDVYSSVPCESWGNARYLGPTSDVAGTLAKYETFVFLPRAIEPFGRAVVEAWAAGLTLVVNKNVGATHYIVNDQMALRTASKDFWEFICG